MVERDMRANVTGPDDDCGVWLNLEFEGGNFSSINLGHPEEPIAHAVLEAAGKDTDVSCTPAEGGEGERADLASLTDIELIMHYETTSPDDPQADRLANEMEARGLDYPEVPLSR